MLSHDNSIVIADALRIVTVTELTVIAGMSCAVLGIYLTANKHIAAVDRARGGALVRHVIAISLSYILLCAFSVAEIQGYYGTSLTYRAPIGFVAGLFGIFGMVNMLQFQNNRLDRRDERLNVDGAP